MKTINITLSIINSLIIDMEKIQKHVNMVVMYRGINIVDDFDVDDIIERIEDTMSRVKHSNTIDDVYISDMLYNIVMTYRSNTSEFDSVKSSSDNSLWYTSSRMYRWLDSSNVVDNLHGMQRVLRGKSYRWICGDPMSARNLYFSNVSMYVLSRYYPCVKDIANRIDILESL